MNRRTFMYSTGALGATPLVERAFARRADAAPQERDPTRWATCRQLAAALLLVGPDGEDLKLRYLKTLIDSGLPRPRRRKKVLIIGAGISGLTAGTLLKQAGHEVVIVEANENRIGGRIKTFRHDPVNQPGSPAPFEDPALLAEAGAMRVPSTHPLTLAFIDKLGLRRRRFHQVDVDPRAPEPASAPPPVRYEAYGGEVWSNGHAGAPGAPPKPLGRTWISANGVQVRQAEYAAHPGALNAGFGAAVDVPAATLLAQALGPLAERYKVATPDGGKAALARAGDLGTLIDGWAQLIYELDDESMDSFLRRKARLPSNIVDAIGTLQNLTSRLSLSFFHSYQSFSEINPATTYWEIEGGTAELPYALLPGLRDHIRMNRRVIRIELWDPRRPIPGGHVREDGPHVWIETVAESGAEDTGQGARTQVREELTADVAIVTVPFSALRQVEVAPLMSYAKRRAIIELHYDAATKVLLEFSRRWWELTSEAEWKAALDAVKPGLYEHYRGTGVQRPPTGVRGGGSITDQMNRFCYYPSHATPGSAGGVVLAVYAWADDAARWDSMDDAERYATALRGLQDLHGERIAAFYTGRGKTQSWMRNRYACGQAAVFTPGQLTRLHPAVATPEGPLHFAGEHTSLKHAWIEGALESAVRVALEI
ncbi:MAG TPA: FAD-dependent oxidoreductase, partial [Kofleriaceae bacterium]|nr:FAD-dependent oxidoreductase [Kofleriaceae bacterium]